MAASDADVTIVKAHSVVIEEDKVTIVADAKARITLVHSDQHPAQKGDEWQGMPVSRPKIIGNKISFVTKRRPANDLPAVWKETLKNAQDLKDGKEVGRIGYYAPELNIKGNMLASMAGEGFLFSKGQ